MIPFTTAEYNWQQALSIAEEVKSFCFDQIKDTDNFELFYENGTVTIRHDDFNEYNQNDLYLLNNSLVYIVRTFVNLYLDPNESYQFKIELPHFVIKVTKYTELKTFKLKV